MKRIVSVLVVLLFVLGTAGSQPVSETQAGQPLDVHLAVMAGPTGFASVGLAQNGGLISDELKVNLQVFPSPNEVIARLANGELDFAALPSNLASTLYNRGLKIKLAAVTGNGMLSVLSSDGSVRGVQDLLGKTVHVPGAGSTPDQMSQLLLMQAGMEAGKDVVLDYSIAAPAQLAQMVIAGKVKLAMLPQPFVSMILGKSAKAAEVFDVQELYSSLSGVETYPMTVLVVSEAFLKNHPRATAMVLSSYEKSVAWVNANPKEAGKAIEEIGIMAAAMATPAIPSCNLVFVPSSEAKASVQAYYNFLYSYNPAAIGGSVPGDELYL